MILAALLGMLSTAPPSEQPLDVREPPFSEFDFAWMNGNNPAACVAARHGPGHLVDLRGYLLRLAVLAANRSHDFSDHHGATAQRDLAQSRAPRRGRNGFGWSDRQAVSAIRVDG